MLVRDETYALRVGNASGAELDGTTSDAEDADSLSDWRIGDTHLVWDTATGSWQEDGMSRSYRVTIEGRPNPLTVPGVPTGFENATLGHRASRVRWNAPADDGGSPITGYEIHGSNNFIETGSTDTFHVFVNPDPHNPGLWSMHIRAVNAVGRGPWSEYRAVVVDAAKVTIAGGGRVIEGADAAFTLTADKPVLSALTPLDVSVSVSESGNMVDSADKVAQTVSFDLDVTTASLSVPTVNDDAVEFDSTVTATITADSDYIVGAPSEAGVLVDDDEPHDTPFAVEDLAARPAGPRTGVPLLVRRDRAAR